MTDETLHLILEKMHLRFGFVHKAWLAQLEAIRALPEAEETER